MSTPTGWGPSHQTSRRQRGRPPWWIQLPGVGLLALWWITGASPVMFVVIVAGGIVVLWTIEANVNRAQAAAEGRGARELAAAEDPLGAVRESCRRAGAGPYLGVDERGGLRFARSQRAVLLLSAAVGEDERGDHPDRDRAPRASGVHLHQARPRRRNITRTIKDRDGVVL